MSRSKVKNIPSRIPEGEAILDQMEFTMEDYSEACKKMGREYRNLIRFILDDLFVKDHSTILEVGPGPGWIGIWMAKENETLKITGLEISKDMIRVATKNKKEEGINDQVEYVLGNAENMKMFEKNSFDVVFSNGSLHHWEHPVKIFNEIERVLKPKGIFCISDGRRDLNVGAKAIFNIAKIFIPKFMRMGWKTSIIAGYTPVEIEELLKRSSLKNKYTLKTDLFDLIIHNK